MTCEYGAQGTTNYDGDHAGYQVHDCVAEGMGSSASKVIKLAACVFPCNGFDPTVEVGWP